LVFFILLPWLWPAPYGIQRIFVIGPSILVVPALCPFVFLCHFGILYLCPFVFLLFYFSVSFFVSLYITLCLFVYLSAFAYLSLYFPICDKVSFCIFNCMLPCLSDFVHVWLSVCFMSVTRSLLFDELRPSKSLTLQTEFSNILKEI
jgi:hypothetical protein